MQFPVADVPRCELCGAPKDGGYHEQVQTTSCEEVIDKLHNLCEWVMWSDLTPKGLGSILRCIAARVLNRRCSLEQLAAAVGMSKSGVRVCIERVRRDLPAVYAAVWPDLAAADNPRLGSVKENVSAG